MRTGYSYAMRRRPSTVNYQMDYACCIIRLVGNHVLDKVRQIACKVTICLVEWNYLNFLKGPPLGDAATLEKRRVCV